MQGEGQAVPRSQVWVSQGGSWPWGSWPLCRAPTAVWGVWTAPGEEILLLLLLSCLLSGHRLLQHRTCHASAHESGPWMEGNLAFLASIWTWI